MLDPQVNLISTCYDNLNQLTLCLLLLQINELTFMFIEQGYFIHVVIFSNAISIKFIKVGKKNVIRLLSKSFN